MFWIGIKYSDGVTEHHVFRVATVYVVGERTHVAGRALCNIEFSHDTSGSRVDTIEPEIAGADFIRADPANTSCKTCHAEATRRLIKLARELDVEMIKRSLWDN